MAAVWLNLVFLLAGSVVTFLVSRWYYARATKDLNQASGQIRADVRRLNALAAAMQTILPAHYKFEWADDGGLTGNVIAEAAGHATIKVGARAEGASLKADLTDEKRPEPKPGA